jgi:hypothetical protein
MLNAIRMIAERQISEAIREGRLNTGNWRGKPLPPENDSFVPEELRMAYKILKNSGYLPPEIETRREIHQLEELIASTEDEHTRLKQMKKLQFLIMKLDSMRERRAAFGSHRQYERKIVERLTIRK